MTKSLIGILLILAAGLISIYIFIPEKIVFSKVTYLQATKDGAERAIAEHGERAKWWPEPLKDATTTKHIYKKFKYSFTNAASGINVEITDGSKNINSIIFIAPLNGDTIGIKWKAELPVNKNPLTRISGYFEATRMKQDMAEILAHVKTYLSNEEKVYGLKIKQEQVKDTILISTKWNSAIYPSPAMIYEKINGLKKYIRANNSIETNKPMLHVMEVKGTYQAMVAIPVDKEMAGNENFVIKKMIPGKILTTEISGGTHTAMETLKKLELYMNDHKLTSPAIPFESLVTDRTTETDTARWITKIYYPIY